MNRLKRNIIAVGVTAVLSLNTANAALNIYSNDVERSAEAKNAGNYEFNQKGLSAEQTNVVRGFGKDMPLGLSLQIIVPNDWKVDLNEAAVNMPVDWKGKSTWPYVLENLAKDNKLLVTIDWEKRVVNVFSKEAEQTLIAKKKKEIVLSEAKRKELSQQSASLAKKAEGIRADIRKQEENQKIQQNKLAQAKAYSELEKTLLSKYQETHPGETASIHQLYKTSNVLPLDKKESSWVKMMVGNTLTEKDEAIYILNEGDMLSEVMTAWAEANGWDLIWDAKSDFRIVQRIEMKGTLINVFDDTLTLYRKSQKPLMGNILLKNKVLNVKDFNYDQK